MEVVDECLTSFFWGGWGLYPEFKFVLYGINISLDTIISFSCTYLHIWI